MLHSDASCDRDKSIVVCTFRQKYSNFYSSIVNITKSLDKLNTFAKYLAKCGLRLAVMDIIKRIPFQRTEVRFSQINA